MTSHSRALGHKQRYIGQRAKIHAIRNLAEFHRNTPEIVHLMKVGLKLESAKVLGFGVPITTRGPEKGLPDPIRYVTKIFNLYTEKVEFVRREMNGRVCINYYRVAECQVDDLGT